MDNDIQNNTVPVEVREVQESFSEPTMTKEELEAIKARLSDYRKIDNELSSADWIRANCLDGGDWAKHADRSLDIQYTLLKSDLDKLIAEVDRLQVRKDACAWEADNAKRQLEGTGITWEEFPYGCDTLQYVATKLAGSRGRVNELESIIESPTRVFRADLDQRSFKIEQTGKRLRDLVEKLADDVARKWWQDLADAIAAWDQAVSHD